MSLTCRDAYDIYSNTGNFFFTLFKHILPYIGFLKNITLSSSLEGTDWISGKFSSPKINVPIGFLTRVPRAKETLERRHSLCLFCVSIYYTDIICVKKNVTCEGALREFHCALLLIFHLWSDQKYSTWCSWGTIISWNIYKSLGGTE